MAESTQATGRDAYFQRQAEQLEFAKQLADLDDEDSEDADVQTRSGGGSSRGSGGSRGSTDRSWHGNVTQAASEPRTERPRPAYPERRGPDPACGWKQVDSNATKPVNAGGRQAYLKHQEQRLDFAKELASLYENEDEDDDEASERNQFRQGLQAKRKRQTAADQDEMPDVQSQGGSLQAAHRTLQQNIRPSRAKVMPTSRFPSMLKAKPKVVPKAKAMHAEVRVTTEDALISEDTLEQWIRRDLEPGPLDYDVIIGKFSKAFREADATAGKKPKTMKMWLQGLEGVDVVQYSTKPGYFVKLSKHNASEPVKPKGAKRPIEQALLGNQTAPQNAHRAAPTTASKRPVPGARLKETKTPAQQQHQRQVSKQHNVTFVRAKPSKQARVEHTRRDTNTAPPDPSNEGLPGVTAEQEAAGWSVHWSDEYNLPYWFNQRNGDSKWSPP